MKNMFKKYIINLFNFYTLHKQSFLSANCERAFSNKSHTQSNAHEKHKQLFPSENYNRTRQAHARATSADSIPPRSL